MRLLAPFPVDHIQPTTSYFGCVGHAQHETVPYSAWAVSIPKRRGRPTADQANIAHRTEAAKVSVRARHVPLPVSSDRCTCENVGDRGAKAGAGTLEGKGGTCLSGSVLTRLPTGALYVRTGLTVLGRGPTLPPYIQFSTAGGEGAHHCSKQPVQSVSCTPSNPSSCSASLSLSALAPSARPRPFMLPHPSSLEGSLERALDPPSILP